MNHQPDYEALLTQFLESGLIILCDKIEAFLTSKYLHSPFHMNAIKTLVDLRKNADSNKLFCLSILSANRLMSTVFRQTSTCAIYEAMSHYIMLLTMALKNELPTRDKYTL